MSLCDIYTTTNYSCNPCGPPSSTAMTYACFSATAPDSYLPCQSAAAPPSNATNTDTKRCRRSAPSSRLDIAHPYARLYAKREVPKRRKMWNHAFEKSLFTPDELATVGAPHRRTIYVASLEAYVDRLHVQLLNIGYFPVAVDRLEPFHGLNSKVAKGIVAGLQHDASLSKLKLLELERSNKRLRELLDTSGITAPGYEHAMPQPYEPPPISRSD